MMENLLVILIVALAGVYVIRSYWKGTKEDASRGCGCSSCGNNMTCNNEKASGESTDSV